MNSSIWMDGIRSLFGIFDRLIYFLIEWAYNTIMTLANTSIFQEGQIVEFAGRVYTLLGIFMLFRVSFSLINYLVNPDSLSDQKIGGSQIVKRVLITLVLIIIVPLGFDLLYRAQSAILSDHILEQFILGTTNDDFDTLSLQIDPEACGDRITTADNNGSFLALLTFRPFYQLYEYKDEYGNIERGFDYEEVLESYCFSSSVGELLSFEILLAEIDKNFGINMTGAYGTDYQMLWSTVVGVVVLLLLITFCFDIAVRTIKLGFLEIIAPIPIISYVDPKSGNNGMFNKWLQDVGKTWASLFIRLASIFFALYFIGIINENFNNGFYDGDIWLMIFLIIGALMFAKQLPKLLEDLLGVKMGGSFQLNPLKKIENDAIGGKQIGKAVIGAEQRIRRGFGGVVVGAALGSTADQGTGHALWSTLKSGASGFFGNEKVGNIRKNQAEYNKKMRMARLEGSTFPGRFRAGVSEYLGSSGEMGDILTREHQIDDQMRANDDQMRANDDQMRANDDAIRNIDDQIRLEKNQISNLNQRMQPAKNRISDQTKILDSIKKIEDRAEDRIKSGKAGTHSTAYLNANMALERLQKRYRDGDSNVTASMIEQQMAAVQNVLDSEKNKYIDDVMDPNNTIFNDGVLAGFMQDYNTTVAQYGSQYGITAGTTGSDIHNQVTTLKADNSRLSRNNISIERQIEQHNNTIASHEAAKEPFNNVKHNLENQRRTFENQRRTFENQKRTLEQQKRTAKANADMPMRPPHMGGGPRGPR